MKLFKTLIFCAAVLTASPAFAVETLYDIQGGTFADGTTFEGTFNYDSDTRGFGDYSVTTFAGTLSALTYNTANSGAYFGGGAGPNNFILFLNNGSRYFNFSFLSPLSPGTQPLNLASSYECLNCSPFRRVTAGTVSTVAAVPEPATWAMMLFGFGGMGIALRRRRNVATIAQLA